MDLRSVTRFLAVAESGSLNKAAQRLNLSQPALSKSIQALEFDLGVPLLDRGPRGIKLTPFGKSTFDHARRISAEVRKLEAEIEAIRTLAYGEINVGVMLGRGSRVLAFAILQLLTENRRIKINVVNGIPGELIRPLLLGDLDFLIATLFDEEETPPDVEQTKLYLDPMTLAVRAGHPILQKSQVELSELTQFPWIALSDSHDTEGALRKLIGSEFEQSQMHSRSPIFVKTIICNSDFIGLVRQDAVSMELNEGLIMEVDLADRTAISKTFPTQHVGLIHRSDVSISTASRALIDEIGRSISLSTEHMVNPTLRAIKP